MYRPLISPKVLNVYPVYNEASLSPSTWIELEVSVAGGGAATVDLFVNEPFDSVRAAIARARSGTLTAVMMPSAQINEHTGRHWHLGSIGPASELQLPPMAEIGGEDSAVFLPVVSPTILRVYSAEQANASLSEEAAGHPITCVDLSADRASGVMHLVVPMRRYEVENFIKSTKALRRRLVAWHQRPIAIPHCETGRYLVFGNLEQLYGGSLLTGRYRH